MKLWTCAGPVDTLKDMRLPALLALLATAGCSSDGSPPHLWGDGARLDGALADIALPGDGLSLPDIISSDHGCTLGTPDNCAACGDVCPPGQDTADTARLCKTGVCAIECKEESYDVNDRATDGCEAKDDTPIHDSKATATDLGTSSDCDKALTVSGVLPSDDQRHQKSPIDRPNGRADWFKLTIDDDFCIIQADVKVSFKSLPSNATFSVSTLYVCKGGKEMPKDVKTAPGGSEVILAPSTVCTTIGDDSGTLYVEVTKESGAHSDASYTVEIEP